MSDPRLYSSLGIFNRIFLFIYGISKKHYAFFVVEAHRYSYQNINSSLMVIVLMSASDESFDIHH
jgi:hypothetical protein